MQHIFVIFFVFFNILHYNIRTTHQYYKYEGGQRNERYGLYEGYPKSISDYMRRRQDALGLERFGFHKLRHYFASQSIDAGIPIPTIQDFGGWSTPKTLNQIYTHNLRDFAELVEKLSI